MVIDVWLFCVACGEGVFIDVHLAITTLRTPDARSAQSNIVIVRFQSYAPTLRCRCVATTRLQPFGKGNDFFARPSWSRDFITSRQKWVIEVYRVLANNYYVLSQRLTANKPQYYAQIYLFSRATTTSLTLRGGRSGKRLLQLALSCKQVGGNTTQSCRAMSQY